MNAVSGFPKALRLAKKMSAQAASWDSASERGALGATDLNNILLSSAQEKNVLLHIRAAGARDRGRKQSLPFS